MSEETSQEFLLESHTDIRKPISLSSYMSDHNMYEFEDKRKTDLVKECFFANRRKVNPAFRNCLSNVNDRDIFYGDIVVYETKDYRVVGIHEDGIIIKNSKRIIDVPVSKVVIKIKDMDSANLFYVYNMLYNTIESGIFDDASFFMAFISVFDIDAVVLYKSLPEDVQTKVRRKLRD